MPVSGRTTTTPGMPRAAGARCGSAAAQPRRAHSDGGAPAFDACVSETKTSPTRASIIATARASELPTPCLVVDVAAADRNIGLAIQQRGSLLLRPHYKAHKCTTLLRRQLAASGCSGVTC